MSTGTKITTTSVKAICSQYGFAYTEEGGKHFATVGEVKTEIRFDESGDLAPGRQAFLDRARAQNEEFRKSYPKKKKKPAPEAGDGQTKRKPQRPKLTRRFLDKYPIGELDTALQVMTDLVPRKRKADELAVSIAAGEERLAKLTGLAAGIKEVGLAPHPALSDETELTQLQLDEHITDREKYEEWLKDDGAEEESASSPPAAEGAQGEGSEDKTGRDEAQSDSGQPK
jgi:hypothetical protein